MTQTRTQTFPHAIEGSRGTLVFGAGVPALTGEITHVSDDHVFIEVPQKTDQDRYPDVIAVPVASIVYYRFAADDA